MAGRLLSRQIDFSGTLRASPNGSRGMFLSTWTFRADSASSGRAEVAGSAIAVHRSADRPTTTTTATIASSVENGTFGGELFFFSGIRRRPMRRRKARSISVKTARRGNRNFIKVQLRRDNNRPPAYAYEVTVKKWSCVSRCDAGKTIDSPDRFRTLSDFIYAGTYTSIHIHTYIQETGCGKRSWRRGRRTGRARGVCTRACTEYIFVSVSSDVGGLYSGVRYHLATLGTLNDFYITL